MLTQSGHLLLFTLRSSKAKNTHRTTGIVVNHQDWETCLKQTLIHVQIVYFSPMKCLPSVIGWGGYWARMDKISHSLENILIKTNGERALVPVWSPVRDELWVRVLMQLEREARRDRNVKHNVSAIKGCIGTSTQHTQTCEEWRWEALKAEAWIALVVWQFTSQWMSVS